MASEAAAGVNAPSQRLKPGASVLKQLVLTEHVTQVFSCATGFLQLVELSSGPGCCWEEGRIRFQGATRFSSRLTWA